MLDVRRWIGTPILTLLVCATPRAARAQDAAPSGVSVRVRVTDSTHVPIAGADVSIMKGLQDVLAHGTTDDVGRATLVIPRGSEDLQVAVRKIGYRVTDQFFAAPKAASTSIELVLRRAVQTLAPVVTTAAEDAKRKSYHVDAELIANSTRTLFNGMDIVTKMMPEIIYGRGGKDSDCGIQDVWVNGVRIVNPPPNEMVAARIPGAPPIPVPQSAMKSSRSGRRGPVSPISMVNMDIWYILSAIKPEHIDELNYEDCFSTTVTDRTHANRALFVVLKPGVAYDAGRGSYVIDSDQPGPARKSAVATTTDSSAATFTPIPAYRARLLGVYDPLTGDAIEHAIVADSATGLRAETTSTGTVSLAFLQEGLSVLRVTKAGYAELRVEVTISPKDSVPVTLLLSRP